jgi:hypothetical protein
MEIRQASIATRSPFAPAQQFGRLWNKRMFIRIYGYTVQLNTRKKDPTHYREADAVNELNCATTAQGAAVVTRADGLCR